MRITRWPNVPLLVSEGGIVLQDVGREVDFGAFHLAEISINLLEAGSGASNIVRRSPEAELKSAIVGDVRVCGSSNSHDGLRGVLDGQILCEPPSVNGIPATLLSSNTIVDTCRRIGFVVSRLQRQFVTVFRRHGG